MKAIVGHDAHFFEMIKVGVKSIQLGTSPTIIASQLLAIVDESPKEDVA